MLLQAGADPSKRDESGADASACCQTQEILKIISQALKRK
jgi:hypothetical protein